ncbi:DUF559 domain-containing protein [Microbacterium sp. KUDC0406]|uniref:endonuclease domain-containing protein n=1 Tax=Microbacterium sp. KUDC0406 TaxID=2909588 RepID=UPI001F27C925|nr:DUF559 domain-containing protein [Microbacterium sp. KUDC0406]UJP11504.1 DUF559 domain-containing protein [Microbacterium sp. KUDC0406]
MKLPLQLGERFHVRDAASAGIRRGRRDARDLHRPFRGIRAKDEPVTFEDVVRCYALRMRATHRLVGRSAMRVWGLPLPWPWIQQEELEIAVLPDAAPPRTSGVRGRRLAAKRAETSTVTGLRVVDPIAACFSVASELTVDQAVAALDAVVTIADNYPGLVGPRPMATISEIEEKLLVWGRFPGCRTIHRAVEKVCERVESPKETETRLLLIDSGLPVPQVQFEVWDGAEHIGRVDLAYPELKIAIEYEGDHHRTDKDQWRRDIQRQRRLEELGWIVIRLTELDLADNSEALIARIRDAIARRATAA